MNKSKSPYRFGFPYKGKEILLSVQHLFAMFGATVLVPLLTGMNPAVALVTAGLGTLLFHLLTKMKVPVFLGSSFAFIPALISVIESEGIPAAQGGIMVAGLVYIVLSVIVYFVGVERVRKILPPVVTGPVIIVIAMSLASTAIKDAFGTSAASLVMNVDMLINVLVAIFVIVVIVIGMVFAKGFFKLVPILIGIAAGYLLCAILGWCGVFHMN